ncbi:hypothetical protein L1049_012267 [Liquidambar formosana]|uniref:Uncharacterized protein n=1 Tax=Liquidambar formosana TaxID=63359 RepID=A0AAP0X015_LIQFO
MDNSRSWRCSPIQSNNSSTSDSDEEPEPSYKNLATINLLIGGLVSGKLEYNKDAKWDEDQSPHYQATQKPSLIKLLSWKRRNPKFGVPDYPRCTPLLNRENDEYGGDDIDNDRRCQLSPSQPQCSESNYKFEPSRFMSSDRFEIGTWEERKLVSRDGKLEIETQIFQASIDQRSEKASGGGACTVLATVIADWLHQNPDILPLRCQFDKLVREGSSEWRNLCESDSHREKFLDQHFDLDTVLEAQVRPLMVISEKSYVGFFELENMPNQLKFLQGAMSFDNIWEELQRNESPSEEKIYIVSWNDHFFVLKVEVNAIYIIDTLGERLFEGCNKAYILKFNKESKVYRVQLETSNRMTDSEGTAENHSSTAGEEEDQGSNRELICEGKCSCKEFITGFLAALPLRELLVDIERGIFGEAPPHHLLQIEFQYTAPCNSQTNKEIQS